MGKSWLRFIGLPVKEQTRTIVNKKWRLVSFCWRDLTAELESLESEGLNIFKVGEPEDEYYDVLCFRYEHKEIPL